MEPVGTAMVAALAMLSEKVVQDAYDGLKGLLIRKFGKDSELVASTEALERHPDSAGRRETLKEELAAANAGSDEEILAAARALLDAVRSLPGGEQTINQTVTGDHNVFSGSGNVTVNRG